MSSIYKEKARYLISKGLSLLIKELEVPEETAKILVFRSINVELTLCQRSIEDLEFVSKAERNRFIRCVVDRVEKEILEKNYSTKKDFTTLIEKFQRIKEEQSNRLRS